MGNLTLPNGVTSYSHPLDSAEGTLTALRHAVKNCQNELNEILTEVVEAERANVKNTSAKMKESVQEEEEEDEEEEDDEEDEDDDVAVGEKSGAQKSDETSESPAKKTKLNS